MSLVACPVSLFTASVASRMYHIRPARLASTSPLFAAAAQIAPTPAAIQ
jgi:hypothetical protein